MNDKMTIDISIEIEQVERLKIAAELASSAIQNLSCAFKDAKKSMDEFSAACKEIDIKT